MKKTIFFLLLLLILIITGIAFYKANSLEHTIYLKTSSGDLTGIVTLPKTKDKIPLALIISGSGPTDKDGNSAMTQNDSLKKLALELSKNKIASLRYDKRGVGESKNALKNQEAIRFDDYIRDASQWITVLKEDPRFSKVIVIGHSEGSLIGMIASAHANAEQYISIAGASLHANENLKEQLKAQPKEIQDLAYPILDSLKNGKTVAEVPDSLNSLFRGSVQPYLISWFRYNPIEEIKKLSIPILIVQGTQDIQVSTEDAKRLARANPRAKLVVIYKMNHIFRIIDGDRQTNLASYNKPSLPIAQDLVQSIVNFILGKNTP